MENFLTIILPKILPKGYKLNDNCFLRPHEGKNDLKKSIPNKIKVFSNFHIPTKIIIIHDQDSNDCKKLKEGLIQLCTSNGDCPVLIRIPCKELENWYLGDMDAIGAVYPKFKPEKYKNKATYRNVDQCFGAYELEKIIKTFQKGFASKNIPNFMNLENNNSTSFNHLISGLHNFLLEV